MPAHRWIPWACGGVALLGVLLTIAAWLFVIVPVVAVTALVSAILGASDSPIVIRLGAPASVLLLAGPVLMAGSLIVCLIVWLTSKWRRSTP